MIRAENPSPLSASLMFKMKYLTSGTIALLSLLSMPASLVAQDDELELGILPELPYLDLGDPDTKPTWHERRVRARNLEAQRRAEEARDEARGITRANATPSLSERIANSRSKPRGAPLSNKITVRNSLPPGESGVTSSGVRLQPFGDDNFWGGMPPIPIEETLVDLPPAPDLRTPDQVTRRERVRDRHVERQKIKEAEADAARERREFEQRAIVNRPPVDPSSALVQVQSQRGSGTPFVGNVEAPQTIKKGQLKPFNESSSYIRDNQIVYKGKKTGSSSSNRWGWGREKD